jgi:hypothetical protein
LHYTQSVAFTANTRIGEGSRRVYTIIDRRGHGPERAPIKPPTSRRENDDEEGPPMSQILTIEPMKLGAERTAFE